MTYSGFGSYGLVNHDSYKSKSLHWTRSKFIGSNRPCLKWEKAIFVILSRFLKYYPLQSHFEPGKIFSFKKKPWLGSHPTLGAMRDMLLGRIKTLIGLMDKRKDLEQKSNDWDRARRRKAIDWGHPRKLWGRLCKSKKWNGRRMPINSKRGKRGFN